METLWEQRTALAGARLRPRLARGLVMPLQLYGAPQQSSFFVQGQQRFVVAWEVRASTTTDGVYLASFLDRRRVGNKDVCLLELSVQPKRSKVEIADWLLQLYGAPQPSSCLVQGRQHFVVAWEISASTTTCLLYTSPSPRD